MATLEDWMCKRYQHSLRTYPTRIHYEGKWAKPQADLFRQETVRHTHNLKTAMKQTRNNHACGNRLHGIHAAPLQ